MAKQKFYDLSTIYGEKANYTILVGERANGKSYSVKENALYIAYHKKDPITKEPISDYMFAYVRRWDLELKGNAIEGYFSDFIQDADGTRKIYQITNGDYSTISVYQRKIYFANVDEEGKIVRGPVIGYPFALTQITHYKSLSYPQIGRMIFEEFITDQGYLPNNEPKRLMDLVSTIFRRRFGRVFLVGNTINRACPYFNEWFPDNKVLKMKPGDIRIYNMHTEEVDEDGQPIVVKIAIERCENSGNNSKMFFGSSAKMITRGEWDQEDQPHLPEPEKNYKSVHLMFIEDTGICYMLQLLQDKTGNYLIYVKPHTKEIKDREKTRIITDQFSLNLFHSHRFLTDLYKYDTIILTLLVNDKIVYSDNLTGTEFKRLLKERGYFK